MSISHFSIFFCFWIRLQSNRFPHACSCKLNSRCSSSPLFPSINPALLPLSLFILFHPSLFSSTFCCVLFVTLHPLPKVLPFFKAEEILCQKHSEIRCFDIVSSPPLPDSLAPSLYTWLSGQLISPPHPPTPSAFGVCLLVTSDKQLLPSMCYKDSQLALALLPEFRPRWSPISTSSMGGFDENTYCSSDQIHGDLIVCCFMRKNWARMPR